MKRIDGLCVAGTLLFGLIDPAHSQAADLETPGVEALVQQLRDIPSRMPVGPPSDGIERPAEVHRHEIYARLLKRSPASVRALARGLRDPDVEFRRHVALALNALSGGWWKFDGDTQKVDITGVLPELVAALSDTDPTVRAWAAQDIGNGGAGAATAVPALLALLARDDEASRNSACIALRGIGPPAVAALPSLRAALSDPRATVRRFAALAIERIEGEQR